MEIKNICPICGSPLQEEKDRLKCRYCGYSKVAEASAEETSLLYVAFQKLRMADFDESRDLFEDIARHFPKSSEAQWGMLLSDYGIKYEDDYDGKKIPTCYAARYESLYDSPLFKKAIEKADDEQKEYFKSQASRIEATRKEWIEKAEKEPPYDVFISFKDTAEDGQRTSDSYDAHEIYNILTGLGYRVFFSRVTLAGKTGENYEPYIFSALNSAPVMLIFASKPEYVTSTWVKNEWNRYLARIRQKEKADGSICVIFKDFSPSLLPSVLRNKQNMKYGELTFLENLKAYVDKYVSEARSQTPSIERKTIAVAEKKGQKSIEAVKVEMASSLAKKSKTIKAEEISKRKVGSSSVAALSASEENKISQAEVYISMGDFAKASTYYEDVLSTNPHSPKALLGSLLCDKKCASLKTWCVTASPSDLPKALEVVNHSKQDVAYSILENFAKMCVDFAGDKEYGKALQVYEAIARYDVPAINKAHSQIFDIASRDLSDDDAEALAKATLPYLSSDKAVFKTVLGRLVSESINQGVYAKGVEFSKEYAKYFDLDAGTYLQRLYAENEVNTLSDLLKDYADQENFSSLSGELPLEEREIDKLFGQIASTTLLLVGNDPVRANAVVRFLLPYRFSSREVFIEKGIEECYKQPNEKTAKVLDGFLHAYGDESFDKFIAAQQRFVDACLAKDDFDLALHYLDRLIEYDPDTPSHYRQRVYVRLGASAQTLSAKIHELKDFFDIESMIAMRGKASIGGVLKEFLDACLAASDIRATLPVFDALIGYFPAEENKELAEWLKKAAALCTEKEIYEAAEKYYTTLVSLNPNDHKSYWMILRCKLKCKDDDALIHQMTPIGDFVEFENAKLAAGVDRDALAYYIKSEDAQTRWIAAENERLAKEEEERKRKARAKKRNRILFASASGAAVIGLAVAALAFFVFIPQNKVSGAAADVKNGNYDAAISALSGVSYGESKNVLSMAYAGKAFQGGDYETGIDRVLEAGGETHVTYNTTGGGKAEKSEETIKPKAKHIDNKPASGYEVGEWSISNFEIHVDGAAYSASLVLTAYSTAIPYPIKYDLKGGAFGAETIPSHYTVEERVDLPTPIRSGYEFLGWKNTADGSVSSAIERGATGEQSLEAQWKIIEYTIKYNLNGGAYEGSLPPTYTVEDAFDLPSPSRVGYGFAGWADGSDRPYASIAKGTTGNLELTARWDPTKYSISYDLGGGSFEGTSPLYQYSITDTTSLAAPTKNGYTFLGWEVVSDPNGCFSESEIISGWKPGVYGNLELAATWQLTTYTIEYDLNGGTYSGGLPVSYTIEDAFDLPIPTKVGYKFLGWAYPVSSQVSGFITSIAKGTTGNLSLTANWSVITYSITYDLAGGTIGSQNPESYTVEDAFELTSPSRNGYSFEGWKDQSGNTITQITKGSTGDLALTAQWSAKLNQLTVMSENETKGTVSIASGSGYTDETITILATPKPCYTFKGWYSGEALLSTQPEYTFTMPSRDYSAIAKFEAIEYSISYDLAGGSLESQNPESYTIEDELSLTSPSKEGYAFGGWKDQNENLISQISKGTHGDLSLTATWSANLNGLTVTSSDEAKGTVSIVSGSGYTDESITVLATPKDGFRFKGWYHGDDLLSNKTQYTFAMPPRDYLLTALFWTEAEAKEAWNLDHGVVPVLSEDGKYVTYGLYPQAKVSDASLISTLGEMDSPDSMGWYLLDDEYYCKLSDEWYVVQPIKWKVLEKTGDELFVVSNLVLDAHRYNENYSGLKDGHYANNYKESEIREWLNGDFYSSAFALGDDRVLTTEVDNSAATTDSSSNQYACENTSDKVFLLSYQDYTNVSYGFYNNSPSRQCWPTDYAIARNVFVAQNGGMSTYWSRSPYSNDCGYACAPGSNYQLLNNVVSNYRVGVRPGLRITLADQETVWNHAHGVTPHLSNGGQYVTYGMYPQDRVSNDSLIGQLNSLESPDAATGWYLLNDKYYCKLSSDWYAVKPIKWKILERSGDELFVVSDLILDQHRYDGSSNNYKESEIREWLNDDFYSSAFALGGGHVLTATLNNSAATTDSSSNPYVCENTKDKVFLPSYSDYSNVQYGFFDKDSRMCKPTDYAVAKGAYKDNDNGNGYYWTRSPASWASTYTWSANFAYNDGLGINSVDYSGSGVRPAMRISLADEETIWNRNHGVDPVLSADSNFVTYGMYPQDKVSDDFLITKLNGLGSVDATTGWYLLDDEYYCKLSDEWYAVQPIKWKVLQRSNEELFLVSELILDSHRYDDNTNNYKESEIREWLNDDFFSSAFALGSEHILTTEVDNSGATTDLLNNSYACENTQDKVFLLSYEDYQNSSYGFVNDASRQCSPTDYAVAKGAYTYNGYGYHWTRSPYSDYSNRAWYVSYEGNFDYIHVGNFACGVRPGIRITIA